MAFLGKETFHKFNGSMNETTLDTDDLNRILQQINDEWAVKFIPVMLFLGLLMLVGIPGNMMVCFYYWFKTRRSTNSVFICTVALYDLTTCCISMPIEIVDNRYVVMFPSASLCKFLRFWNYFGSLGSGLTLVIIAFDRFRRICRPFKSQLTMGKVKVACGVTALLAIFFAWPGAIFYDTVPVNVSNDMNMALVGRDCTTRKEPSYKLFIMICNGLHFLLFVGSLLILVVTYCLVGRVLFRHKQTQRRTLRLSASRTNESSCSNGSSVIYKPAKTASSATKSQTPANGGVRRSKLVTCDVTSGECAKSVNIPLRPTSTPAKPVQASDQFDINTVKFTVIMLVIAIMFILSFLPYLIIMVWRTLHKSYEGDIFTTDAQVVAYQFGIRTYFLNSATNPMTYGFFNSKFRGYFWSTCFRRCKRTHKQQNSIRTSSDVC